ncbi:MAG: ribosome small subunit-dependent GTPase A [Spirochaetaceae bacterium]|jgi:ribosome biogenesis GTPase|nr:ribosome small subunit-dependent GTPase A [Spirochaetaceae bacterium]
MRGLVVSGSRNVFTIKPLDGGAPSPYLECRIKGKVLKVESDCYNPLAPGDIVAFEPSGCGQGMILGVEPRTNLFARFNRKKGMTQTLAANIDQIVCVTSPAQPPFRPRFIDRVLAQAEASRLPAMVLLNKSDLTDADCQANGVESRLADYRRIGYTVMRTSALSGEGVAALRSILANRLSVFTGQSGVGKSSLINILLPGAKRQTGAVNTKHDRGNHTTVLSALLEDASDERINIIDTPGVRQLSPDGVSPQDLASYMKEFSAPALHCAFGASCTHVSESGCSVLSAVAAGAIHPDRYESFTRIRSELQGKGGRT